MSCLNFAMKRVPRNPDLTLARSGLLTIAAVLAMASVQPLAAQSSGGGFSLPTPTPTPTAAPQGPADERAGVQIGPRVIRQATPTPTPAPTPAATAGQTPAPTPTPTATRPRPTPTPTAVRTASPTPTPTARTTPRPTATSAAPAAAPTRPEAQIPSNPGAPGTEVPIESDIAPGFDSIPEGTAETAPVGPDDWYDVSGNDADSNRDAEYAAADSFAALQAWGSTQSRIIAGIVLLLLVIGAIALVMWRRRRRESVAQSTPNTALASGIRKSMADQMPSVLQDAPDWSKGDGPARRAAAQAEPEVQPEPEIEPEVPAQPEPQPAPAPEPGIPAEPEPQPAPAPEPEIPADPQPDPAPEPDIPVEPDPVPQPEPVPVPVVEPEVEPEPEPEIPTPPVTPPITPASTEPARIDLELEIVSATRSMMMFTVEYRLDVCNRSNNAVRDVKLSGKLASAQRGATNAAPLASGQPIGELERIGPHQSQRITGKLQLPLSEVTPIMQGKKPLLVPLLHITLDGAGVNAMSRSFVLGTPSAAGTGRVHPLPLDGPPGGLPALQAQLVIQQDTGAAQPEHTA